MSDQAITPDEQAVLEKLLAYAVTMRDAAARHGADDQWTRYAHVSTVVEEVIGNGWDDFGDFGSLD